MSAVGSFAGGGGRASGLGRLLKKLNYPNTVGLLMAGLPSESYVTPTVSTNLTTWTQQGVATPVGGQADPTGGSAAYLVTVDSSTGTHRIYTSPTDWTTGTDGTFKFYVKRGTGTYNVCLASGSGNAIFDLGAVTATPSGATATIQAVAGYPGWYLCTLNTLMAGTAVIAYLDSQLSYAGDGTSSLYLYAPAVSQPGSVSQLVNPFYKSGDPTKGLIQTVDQSSFPNMPLKDAFASGREAALYSAGSYMQGTLAASFAAPWMVAQAVKYVASGANQRLWTDSAGNGVYVNGTTNTIYSSIGGVGSSLSPALADGDHLIAVGQDAAGNVSCWADDATTPTGTASVAATALSGYIRLGSNTAGAANWSDRMGAMLPYNGSDFAAKLPSVFAVLKALEGF